MHLLSAQWYYGWHGWSFIQGLWVMQHYQTQQQLILFQGSIIYHWPIYTECFWAIVLFARNNHYECLPQTSIQFQATSKKVPSFGKSRFGPSREPFSASCSLCKKQWRKSPQSWSVLGRYGSTRKQSKRCMCWELRATARQSMGIWPGSKTARDFYDKGSSA